MFFSFSSFSSSSSAHSSLLIFLRFLLLHLFFFVQVTNDAVRVDARWSLFLDLRRAVADLLRTGGADGKEENQYSTAQRGRRSTRSRAGREVIRAEWKITETEVSISTEKQ